MGTHRLKIAWLRMRSGGRVTLGKGSRVRARAILDPAKGRIAIGKRADIREGAMILAFGGDVRIGDHFSLNPYSILYGHGGLTIGNWVRVAAHVVIVAFDHGFRDAGVPIKSQPETRNGIVIEDDVWIGAGAIVLDGAHISRGCVIGAGAVVKGTTEPMGIYVGSPARKVSSRT